MTTEVQDCRKFSHEVQNTELKFHHFIKKKLVP